MSTQKQLYIIVILVLVLVTTKSKAGPLERTGRSTRDVYPEIETENERAQPPVCVVGDVVYNPEEVVPAEQPCLKCKCRPPAVICETVICQKRPGCKAIHKPNKCCPDYQCECEVDEKIYANGEKLETTPGNECKVCYCRGGEVQCAEVSCYIRKDCEGRSVEGQCCPKYDHCPPIDSLLERPILTTESTTLNKEIYDLLQNTSDSIRTSNEIHDDDASLYNSTVDSIENQQEDSTVEPISISHPHKITIHEIIPEKKEIPVVDQPPAGTLLIEESTDNASNIVSTDDSHVDSSEISEVFHRAPPVLRVGDKLLFLKKDNQQEVESSSHPSVITIIGAEGLQRGGFEESGEVLEVKVNSRNNTNSLFDNSNDLELKTSESTHILSLVKKKGQPTTTTSVPVDESTQESVETTTLQGILLPVANESTGNITINNERVVEQNPAYPPIPEIMSSYADEENVDKVEVKSTGKILTDVLEIRNNKTIPQNVTNSEWLKSSNENVETTTIVVETETTMYNSVESMETVTKEDSGESTTPKTNHSSIISTENASVEKSDSEASDMVGVTSQNSDESSEVVTKSPVDDVEMIDKINVDKKQESSSTEKDVELFNVDTVTKSSKITNDDKILYEMLPEPQAATKVIFKRANAKNEEADEVFKELELELNPTERNISEDDQKKEADKIFKELLEETENPTKKSSLPKSKESEMIDKVSDALAKLALRGKADVNVLGVLTNFFSSQNRQYNN